MIASIHDALVIDAVSYSEHVGYFMGDHSKGSIFDQVIIDLVRLFLEEALIVASK